MTLNLIIITETWKSAINNQRD